MGLVAVVLLCGGIAWVWHLHAIGSDVDFREGVVAMHLPLSANPLLQFDDPVEQDVARLTYRDLMRLDNSAYPVPDLAKRITISDDGLHCTVELAAAQWSDGSPISARDVTGTVYLLQHSVPDAGIAHTWRQVSAHVQDAHHLRFDLPRTSGSFLTLLAQTPILPLGSWSTDQLLHPAPAGGPLPASGPFVLTSLNDKVAVFNANPHAGAKPKLSSLALQFYPDSTTLAQAFSGGEVDAMVAADPAAAAVAAKRSAITALTYTSFRFVDLVFNQRTAIGSDSAIGHALADAVDRNQLIAISNGLVAQPQYGAIPAGISWAVPPAPSSVPSIPAAAALLDSDGWHTGAGGIRFRGSTMLQLKVGLLNQQPLLNVGSQLQAQLRQIGVDVVLQPLSAAQFAAALNNLNGMDAVLADWDNGPDPDMSSYWHSNSLPPAGQNIGGGPSDPFLDEALDRLSTLVSKSDRRQAAAGVSKELANSAVAVFLYAPKIEYLVSDRFHLEMPASGDAADRFTLVALWSKG